MMSLIIFFILKSFTKPAKNMIVICTFMFDQAVPEKKLNDIREATNKAWKLVSKYFKEQIEKQIKRPATPRKLGSNQNPKNKIKSINYCHINI